MRALACLGFAVAASGCATLMAGGPDHIPVSSNPPGATVFVDGVPVGQTPMIVTLDREHGHGTIQIQAPGYAPAIIQRDKDINGWFWANICVGIWPMIIDLVTGDFKAFDDTPIAIGLTPGGGGYGPPPMQPMQPMQPVPMGPAPMPPPR